MYLEPTNLVIDDEFHHLGSVGMVFDLYSMITLFSFDLMVSL